LTEAPQYGFRSRHYNFFRDYDPKTGRYLEADPIGQKGGLNVFAYVLNSPIADFDPYGLNNFGGPIVVDPDKRLSRAELDCISAKLAKLFGAPFVGVAGPLAGMAKTGATAVLGVYMFAGGVIVTGAGGVMTLGGSVSGVGGALPGIPTMFAGTFVATSGAGLAAVQGDLFLEELDHAIEILRETCACGSANGEL
jgi:RHS repeat-associated protein